MTMLDKFLRYSSLYGTLLIFCGVLKLILYYNYFDIQIVDFLTFSEILTSFFDDINVLLIISGTMIFVSIVTIDLITSKYPIKFEEILKFAYRHRRNYLIFFITMSAIVSSLVLFDVCSLSYYVIYLLVFFCVQIFSFLSMTKNENGEIEYSDSSLLISLGIVIVFSIFLLAHHDYLETKSSLSKILVVTTSDRYELSLKNKNHLIGKTDNYIFFESDSGQSIEIIPMTEIKQIKLYSR